MMFPILIYKSKGKSFRVMTMIITFLIFMTSMINFFLSLKNIQSNKFTHPFFGVSNSIRIIIKEKGMHTVINKNAGQHSNQGIPNQTNPAVAWLMSYPNSGTSYTLKLCRELSNMTTATNYGLEGEIKDKPSTPLYPENPNGPFLEIIPNEITVLPTKFILTKTHCDQAAICENCLPNKFIVSRETFLKGCLFSKKGVWKNVSDSRELEIELIKVWYSISVVKKAIHLIRDVSMLLRDMVGIRYYI